MNQRKFMQNAALLSVTGLILRGAGLLLRVLLANALGEAGMGLYSLTFTVYNLFITLAQSGIAAAVTRLVAEHFALNRPGKARGALNACLKWAMLLSGTAGILLFLLSGPLAARWIGNADCRPALQILAFSLPFMAISACLSGYFIARREVMPNCFSQLLEQTIRILVAAGILFAFRDQGIALLLGLTFLANTLSEGASCLFLAGVYRKKRPRESAEGPERGAIRRIALPVAASRYLSTALHSTENILIPLAIAHYSGSYQQGLAEFGALKGMAIPLLFFPASFLTALSSLLVPEVTDTSSRRDMAATRRIIGRSLEITICLSVMISGVFLLYGRRLGELLFHSATTGRMLVILAPITPFMYLDTIADGLLKGMDLQSKTLRNNTMDSVLRVLLTALVVPRFGMNGFLGVMVFSNLLISTLNLRSLLRACAMKLDWRGWVCKPMTAAGLAAAIWALLPVRGSLIQMLVGMVIWCSAYLLLYWLTLPEKNSIIKMKKAGKVWNTDERSTDGMAGGGADRCRGQKRRRAGSMSGK